MNPLAILITNLIATWYMVGVIWVIQIVHYPLFSRVGAENFPEYEHLHSSRITPIVGIPMVIELLTAVALCSALPSVIPRWLAWSGLALVLAIWLSTALLQVPCHQKLSHSFQPNVHAFLVASNWLRTILWTTRGGLLAYALWLVLKSGHGLRD